VSNFHSIIKFPSITEKNTAMRASENKYVFSVDPKASKVQVRAAVEALFKVKVLSVNTMVVKGKLKRQGRAAGYRSDWKKAIVRLEKGQTIDKFGETA
jgi:large subunit ribosomal protein L23